MTATANFVAAAKEQNRKPTILMKIESADGNEVVQTTKGDWDGAATLTNISTDLVVGSAIPNKVLDLTNQTSVITYDATFTSYARLISDAVPFDLYPQQMNNVRFMMQAPGSVSSATADVRLDIYDAATGGNFICSTETKTKVFTNYTTFFGVTYLYTDIDDYDIVTSGEVVGTVANYYARPVITNSSVTVLNPSLRGYGATGDNAPESSTNANIETSTFDLGAIPATSPIISIDDVIEANSTAAYTAEGSNTDSWPGTALGTVADGDSLTAYRYYRVTGFFTSTGGRSQLNELSINEGIFDYFGTHLDQPFAGVKPYILPGSLSPLTQKIDLKKGITTVGEAKVGLAWVRDVSDLLATGFLKGKDVQILCGFEGLASTDYLPVIVGTWYDYTLDAQKRAVTVVVRDVLKQFEKVKLPLAEYNASGVQISSDISYSNANLIAVIEDLFEEMGLRSRYIHEDYATLETGDLSGDDYRCTRVLGADKPKEVWKLLDQLAQTAGLFLVPQGDGRLKPKLYDVHEQPEITLDANDFTFGRIKGNQRDLFTRFLTYYNWASGVTEPGSEDDYDNAYSLFNEDAETLWEPEKGQRDFQEMWQIGSNAGVALSTPPQALIDWAERNDGWFSNPKVEVTFTNMPPRYATIEVGDTVAVDNLDYPVPKDDWDSGTTYSLSQQVVRNGTVYESLADSNLNNDPETQFDKWQDTHVLSTGKTHGMKFLAVGRKYDPNDAKISLTLREMPKAGELYFASSFSITNGTEEAGTDYTDTFARDKSYHHLNEVSGSPGFLFTYTFTGVERWPKTIEVVGRYQGNPAHNIKLQIYNDNTATWDNVTAASNDFASSSTDALFSFDITGTLSDYVSGTGEVQVRFNHTSSGVATHDFYMDRLCILSV